MAKAKKAAKPAKAKKSAKIVKAKPIAKAKPVKKEVKAKPAPVAKKAAEPAKKTQVMPKVALKKAEETVAPAASAPILTVVEKPPKSTAKSRAEAAALNEEQKKWSALHEQLKKKKAVPYVMSGDFPAKTPLEHKVLGWGYVIEARENRIDVLFESGMKTLISNYKP